MKKLVVMMSLVLVGIVCQAAQVAWSAVGITPTGSDGLTSMNAYLFDTSALGRQDLIDGLADSSKWLLGTEGNGGLLDSALKSVATTQFGATKFAQVCDGNAGTYAEGSDPSLYMVVFNSSYDKYIISSQKDFTDVGGDLASVDVNWSTDLMSATWTDVKASLNPSGGDVPEPTSSLLLLVGGALLALRRKQK